MSALIVRLAQRSLAVVICHLFVFLYNASTAFCYLVAADIDFESVNDDICVVHALACGCALGATI